MAGPILVPLTLSSSAKAKLPVIEQHAKALNSDILLLHVMRGRGAPPEEGLVTAQEAHARTHLDAVAAGLRTRGLRAHSLVRTGPIASTVRDTASRHSVALIVVGSATPGKLSALFARTPLAGDRRDQAASIARLAPCPVLVVRPPAEPQPALRHFDADAACVGPIAPHALGTRTVEVTRIVGTVPPFELAADFRPVRRRREDEERQRALTRQMAERPERLPPPELYKLGYGYYVFAGHAHVAAALAIGQTWIDATVTEYVPLADAEARRVLAERMAFERETGLTGIGAARLGTYARLRALIEEFAAAGEGTAPRGAPQIDARTTTEELGTAATRWKAAIFRPLQRRLRALRLNHLFPGERSADIIVRIADHRRAESQRRRQQLYWDEAIVSFAAAEAATTADPAPLAA